MKNFFLLTTIILLSGCQTAQPNALRHSNIVEPTPQCVNIAVYARSIGVLKQAGISMSDLDEYKSSTLITQIPIQSVENYSIGFKGNPAELYNDVLSKCQLMGWDQVSKVLKANSKPPSNGLKLTRELLVK